MSGTAPNLRSVCAHATRGDPENGSWPTSSAPTCDPTGSESDSSLSRERQDSEPSRYASFATALLAAGESPKVVQERLGHSSISVTLDLYSAVLPNMQREAVERLAEMFDV